MTADPDRDVDLVAADPATRHRVIADRFAGTVRGVVDWDVPTPVPGWVARDVVDHLIGWSSGLFGSAAGLDLGDGPAVAEDPAGAWDHHRTAIQAALDDPAVSAREVAAGPMPAMPLDRLLDAIYVNDVFSHTWDLAVATGQDPALDEAYCAHLLAGSRAMEQPMRESGQYGPAVAVPADAPAQDQLIGFLGRDPGWRPPGSGAPT